MTELTERMLDSWTPNKTVRINDEFRALTSKIALKTFFDLDDPGDHEQFSETWLRPYDREAASDF